MLKNNNHLLEQCLQAVRKAGEIIQKAWVRPDVIHHKALTDLVTETDFAVQTFLEKELLSILPDAAFLGEEAMESAKSPPDPLKDLCWIVDPVDGTTNFVHRIPFMACSVALWENGNPLLGVVNAPMLNEIYYAQKGAGAFCNGEKIRVSSVERAEAALVCTGLPYDPSLEMAGILKRLERIIPATQGLRRLGAAALDLAYVACGKLDAFYEYSLKPWDLAAGVLLVLEAGGNVSDFQGKPHIFGQPLLADNGWVHKHMLDLLASQI